MIGQSNIGGKKLLGLIWFKVELGTLRPTILKIKIRRNLVADPNCHLFGLTTNEKGTETKFSGSIELRNAAGTVTHVVEFSEASALSYETKVSDDPVAPAVESFELIAPKFTIKAAGKTAEFASREKRHIPAA